MRSDGGRDYNPRDYPPVAVTVDVALFAIRRDELCIVLIQRGVEPFAGAWALPGGFVLPDEDLDAAAARELAEETGVTEDSVYLEQLRSYGSPGRDPRMRVVTVAYWGACSTLPAPLGRSDAAHAELVRVSQIEEADIELAFDHEAIVGDALERVRAKLEYTALAARFCPPEFTISELRNVYETVWNTKLDPGNFQRKVRENRSFQQVGQSRLAAGAEPALGVRAQQMRFERAEGSWDPADEASANDAMDFSLSQPELLQDPGPVRPRSGRPASLWIAGDSDLTLNSPIPRRRATRKA
ncbi:MAG: NUDIX domain-containing protein [Bryobacterales bacterium]|nr:NUDIX domain-containing protein [Bryobacterales bacterium]